MSLKGLSVKQLASVCLHSNPRFLPLSEQLRVSVYRGISEHQRRISHLNIFDRTRKTKQRLRLRAEVTFGNFLRFAGEASQKVRVRAAS